MLHRCSKSEIKSKIRGANEQTKLNAVFTNRLLSQEEHSTKYNRIEPKILNSESNGNSNDTHAPRLQQQQRQHCRLKGNRKSLLVAGLTSLLEWFLSLDYRNFTIFTDEICTGRYFRRICLIHKVHCHLSSVFAFSMLFTHLTGGNELDKNTVDGSDLVVVEVVALLLLLLFTCYLLFRIRFIMLYFHLNRHGRIRKNKGKKWTLLASLAWCTFLFYLSHVIFRCMDVTTVCASTKTRIERNGRKSTNYYIKSAACMCVDVREILHLFPSTDNSQLYIPPYKYICYTYSCIFMFAVGFYARILDCVLSLLYCFIFIWASVQLVASSNSTDMIILHGSGVYCVEESVRLVAICWWFL